MAEAIIAEPSTETLITAPVEGVKPETPVVADVVKPDAAVAPVEVVAPIVVPEKYEDFKLPEGFKTEVVDRATPLFKDLGLPQDSAQKVVDFLAQEHAKQQEAISTEFTAWKDSLLTEAKADKEWGGEKLTEHAGAAAKFIKDFSKDEGKAMFALLDQTGLGNHIEVIKLFATAAKAMAEDNPSFGGAGERLQSTEEKIYPSMFQTK